MKTFGAFLLVSLLVISSGTRIPRGKPGLCPFVAGRCRMLNPPDNCHSDFECPNELKCCEMICGRDCVKPIFV